MRQLSAGADGPLWIVAGQQSKGRGRGGRPWLSPKGNLYATLLLRLSISASIATQLPFVAALAAYDAAAEQLTAAQIPDLRLKWPNDIMLGGAKLAGILIESLSPPDGNGLAVIIGFGVNAAVAPPVTDRAAATLGCSPEGCVRLFETLANASEIWLNRWNHGSGFADIRETWLSRAHAAGEPISVNLNGSSIRGRFHGLDQRGALQLETAPGVVVTVNAGDIYPDIQG